MPPRQREIALLRWRDRMRATEIAAALGIAEGTVHAQLHGARRKLVAGLERYYPFGSDCGEGVLKIYRHALRAALLVLLCTEPIGSPVRSPRCN